MASESIDFTGMVAIVTGASRGIGRVIALGLARRGAAVVGTARTLEGSSGAGGTLKGTAEAAAAFGHRMIAVPADITNPGGAQSVVDAATAELGRVDVLVNNAGVFPYGRVADFAPDEWEATMAINLRAPFLMCRAVLPVMIAQGGGNIFNVTSGAATSYSEGRIAYAASKAGLDRFSLSLAEEVREHGIAVNAWSPGFIATDMNDHNPKGNAAAVVEESVMWALAQGPAAFTGQLVRRADFGTGWGPGR